MRKSLYGVYLLVQPKRKIWQKSATSCSLVDLALSPCVDYWISHITTLKLNKIWYLKHANYRLVKPHEPRHYSIGHGPNGRKKPQTSWNFNHGAMKSHHQRVQGNRLNYSMLLLAAKKVYTNILFGERKKMVRALEMAQITTLMVKIFMQKLVSVFTIM